VRVILIEYDDSTRATRLIHDRKQPKLNTLRTVLSGPYGRELRGMVLSDTGERRCV
jgi:hypothetical protein